MDTERAKATLRGTRFADFRWLSETVSTNSDALAALSGGASDVVVVADHQTAGRGRLDRHWESPPGASILMSIGTTRSLGEPRQHLLVTAVALAAIEACDDVAGFRPGLKWPNDLVAVGAGEAGADLKLAGVLAEVHMLGRDRTATVVGIGVNCNWGGPGGPGIPFELSHIATSLDLVSGAVVDRDELCLAVVSHVDDLFATLEGVDGVGSILGAAREESATIGRQVRVQLPTEELAGRAVGLDDVGALVVELPDRSRRTVVAGDVVHVRPA